MWWLAGAYAAVCLSAVIYSVRLECKRQKRMRELAQELSRLEEGE